MSIGFEHLVSACIGAQETEKNRYNDLLALHPIFITIFSDIFVNFICNQFDSF